MNKNILMTVILLFVARCHVDGVRAYFYFSLNGGLIGGVK